MLLIAVFMRNITEGRSRQVIYELAMIGAILKAKNPQVILKMLISNEI